MGPHVLGELLDTLRLDTLVYRHFELRAPWGIQFPDDDPVYLIAVESGEAELEVSGREVPVALSSGDLALLPRGGAHRLSDAAGGSPHLLSAAECRGVHSREPIRLGRGGARTSLVLAAFRFRAAHRALSIQRLSRLILLAADAQPLRSGLASAVRLFIAESTSREPGAAVVVNRLADSCSWRRSAPTLPAPTARSTACAP
jgi:hypothetical protein